jgi:hypothetical protein
MALTVGVQAAIAADLPSRKSDCVNNQRIDSYGQPVRDANGNPVPCGAWVEPTSSWLDGDMPLYLGAGAVLIGGGIAAAVVTSSSSNGGNGGSSQQNQLITLLLLNNAHPASP